MVRTWRIHKGVNQEQLFGHAWELEVTKRTDENFEGTISYYSPNGKTPGKYDITGRAAQNRYWKDLVWDARSEEAVSKVRGNN